MSRSIIADSNVRVGRGQDAKFRVTMSPAQDITGWSGFGLTIREDPLYPRRAAADVAAARSGDIDMSDWEEALTSTTAVAEDTDEGIFYLTVSRANMLTLSPGTNRYVLDVWRLDSGTYWQVVPPTWLSVLESVRDG